MKWYFAVSETSLDRPGHGWRGLIRGAVISAARNTTLVPHMLYDGRLNDFTSEIEAMGVTVIPYRVSFYDHLEEYGRKQQGYLPIASGAFLRIEIPLIETEDELVLYTDADVLFLRNPTFPDGFPKFFAVAPETEIGNYEDMNSGVMLINVPAMRETYPDFRNSILTHLHIGFDQENFRLFFKDRYAALSPTLNWKPHWGINPDAQIVHWHGPKPATVRHLLGDPSATVPISWDQLFRSNRESYAHYVSLWEKVSGQAATVPKSSVKCVIDEIDGAFVRGWAANKEDRSSAVQAQVLIDGNFVENLNCSIDRPDVRQAGYGRGLKSGFSFFLPPAYADGKTHQLQFRDLRGIIVEIERGLEKFSSYEFSILNLSSSRLEHRGKALSVGPKSS